MLVREKLEKPVRELCIVSIFSFFFFFCIEQIVKFRAPRDIIFKILPFVFINIKHQKVIFDIEMLIFIWLIPFNFRNVLKTTYGKINSQKLINWLVYCITKVLRSPLRLGHPLQNICVTYDHGYDPLVEVTISFLFPLSWLIIVYDLYAELLYNMINTKVPLEEHELFTLSDHTSPLHLLVCYILLDVLFSV